MKTSSLLSVLCAAGLYLAAQAGATFTIIAVDPNTGEVGAAGASCVPAPINAVIADVHPGLGAIYTQSAYHPVNQALARQLMEAQTAPQDIVEILEAQDLEGNPGIRQYGVIDLFDGGRSAAFTGETNFDYKNHILGPTYAIQGNTLAGPHILENMEAAFTTTSGTLADRLMAALQGANEVGADNRCGTWNFSSLSAGITVARPNDERGAYYLDLGFHNEYGFSLVQQLGLTGEVYALMAENSDLTAQGPDPIDGLQAQYDQWKSVGETPAPNGYYSVLRLQSKSTASTGGLTVSGTVAGGSAEGRAKSMGLQLRSWGQLKSSR
ncbi:MAG: DUF1028 domain-containing protein [Candidatus Latescibacteria bacterium]|nr:DUF1028 domain-containing protein [Candidatus Latescibacterota bacterium]